MARLQLASPYLEGLARSGVLATYSEVLEHFGLPKMSKEHPWSDSEMFKIFGQIDREDIQAGRPMRTSSVVKKSKERKTIPSDGYFAVLCNARQMPIPRAMADKRRIHALELNLLREYYGFVPGVSGQNATPAQRMSARQIR